MTPQIRLLPAVIGIGAILLGLKLTGIAFTAEAAAPAQTSSPAATQPPAPLSALAAQQSQTAAATPAPAAAAAPAGAAAPASAAGFTPAPVAGGAPAATPASGPPMPGALGADPTAAITAALPIPPVKHDTEITPTEGSEMSAELASAGMSPAEVDVLSSLAVRRNALDERERQIDMRASLLAATEKRLDDKIAELKAIQDKIENLFGQHAKLESDQIDTLVKIYSAMKPKDAARIFASLDDDVLMAVAGRMKPDAMAGILAQLPSEAAQKLTVRLATRFRLPADVPPPTAQPAPAAAATSGPPPAAAPAPPAPAAAPASQAANPAAPQQTNPGG